MDFGLEEAYKMKIARLERELARCQKQLLDYSWKINPDRMGGQFTEQEIAEAQRGGHGW